MRNHQEPVRHNSVDGVVARREAAASDGSESESPVTGLSRDPESALAFVNSVLDVIREPLLVLDENLLVCSVNQAYLGFFRVTREDVVGRSLFDVDGHRWDTPSLRDGLLGLLAGSGAVEDFEVVDSVTGLGQRTMFVNARVPAGVDGIAPSLLFSVDDATERMQSRAVLENERRFRDVIDALPVAIYTTDAHGGITHVNPAAVELSGRTPHLGTDRWCVSWKLFLADGTPLPLDKCPMAIALTQGHVVHGGEYLIERPDGSRRWFSPYPTPIRDAEGTIVGGINMLMDITERKDLEKQRREKDLQYRTLVEQVKDYAIFRTDPQGIATTWNEGVKRLFGFDEAEFIGRDVAHLIFTGEDVERGVPQQELVQAAAVGRVSNDRWMRRKDGTRFYAMGVTSVLRDADGKLVGYTKVKRDQTTQKQLEDDLRQSSAELSEADRRKNEFLATLAHELRNPLAPIQNALRVMRLKDGDAEAVRMASGMLERQVSQMVRLVDDLLDVSRISRGTITLRREQTDLVSVVETAVETARPNFESVGQELSISLPRTPVIVDGDPVRLAQVVGNLLNNACKFTSAGGRIALTLAIDGASAVVRIRDTGIGIADDQLRHVFGLFSQVDTSLERSAGGLGIGLAIVKNMVELHGGTVAVRSEGLGHGSEFEVRLPIVNGALPQEVTEDGPPASTRVGKLRILIADDNPDSAESLAILLGLAGHESLTAVDGVEAVEAAERTRPDVIVLDIGMPRLNGFEACRAIRQQPWGANALIIALSGWGQSEDRKKSAEAGFDAHFVKPVDHTALLKLLSSY